MAEKKLKVRKMLVYQDNLIKLYCADARQMTEIPDESVQCVVTSPPYWGLRKYAGNQDLIWGGEPGCNHEWIMTPPRRTRKESDIVNLESKEATNRGNLGIALPETNTCSICGAWRGAYGLEPTPEMYVQDTIEFLREIRRVLRKDGVVFWNIGDTYAGSYGNRSHKPDTKHLNKFEVMPSNVDPPTVLKNHPILKPKDLCLIPFRVAIAAQEDGWWVRSVIIWAKPNAMPESVKDRPTESHEYILMLTKSAHYYWDQEAVRESYAEPLNRWGGPEIRTSSHKYIELGGHDGKQHYGATSMFRKGRPVRPIETGRNLRSVWTFPTQPYPEAHFATFPERLPEICIKAATPEVGCCSKCGKPWKRVIGHKNMEIKRSDWGNKAGDRTASSGTMLSPPETTTIGWQPQCKCNADTVPSLVLDPFAGSGTTLWVAKKLGRRAIGYEISLDYCKLAIYRNRQIALG